MLLILRERIESILSLTKATRSADALTFIHLISVNKSICSFVACELFGIEKRLHATNEQIDLFTDIKWMKVKATAERVDLDEERIDEIIFCSISNIEEIKCT